MIYKKSKIKIYFSSLPLFLMSEFWFLYTTFAIDSEGFEWLHSLFFFALVLRPSMNFLFALLHLFPLSHSADVLTIEIKLVCLFHFEVALLCEFTEIFRSFSFALSIYFFNEVSWTINNSCFMYSFLLPFSKVYGLVKRNRLRCSVVWMISNGKKSLSAPSQVQQFTTLASCTSNV